MLLKPLQAQQKQSTRLLCISPLTKKESRVVANCGWLNRCAPRAQFDGRNKHQLSLYIVFNQVLTFGNTIPTSECRLLFRRKVAYHSDVLGLEASHLSAFLNQLSMKFKSPPSLAKKCAYAPSNLPSSGAS